MKLSPHQVRTVLDVNEQTLRYWKRIYPELSGRRGYGPCYSFSEVLVLLITKRLVDQLGVDVSKLIPVTEALFTVCREAPRFLTQVGEVVWIDIETMKLTSPALDPNADSRMRIALPLHALALELRTRILRALGDDEATQTLLPFGPTALTPRPRRRKA